jgi:hypothetical protein
VQGHQRSDSKEFIQKKEVHITDNRLVGSIKTRISDNLENMDQSENFCAVLTSGYHADIVHHTYHGLFTILVFV